MPYYKDKSGNVHFLESADDFGLLPTGSVNISDATAQNILEPVQTPETFRGLCVLTIQNRLDTFAKAKGYDGILSAATYAQSLIPRLAAEGKYAAGKRDDTWETAYLILNAVLAGERPKPTVEELIAELPTLEW